MASIQKDPSGNYHIHFRFGGKRFKRSLRTKVESEALTLCGRVEENIRLVNRGIMEIPPSGDAAKFLLSDGKVSESITLPDRITLGALIDEYIETASVRLEDTTLYTLGVHARHLKRILGKSLAAADLSCRALDEYVTRRQAENTSRGNSVTATTVKKEIATLRATWNWGWERHDLPRFPNTKDLPYAKTDEKPDFQTWEEIDKQIARGGLSLGEQAELWECLFLSTEQIAELLDHIKHSAAPPFLYPMAVAAAHTGARRSELMRSRVSDLRDDTLIIRERKRSRKQRTTRPVHLSTRLRCVLDDWIDGHPGGAFLFCHQGRNGLGQLTPDQAHDHLKRALNGSKWEVLRGWHILRHSFISNCALKGIDQRIIDSFVGHTTEEMRRRYTHLFPSAKKSALASVFG